MKNLYAVIIIFFTLSLFANNNFSTWLSAGVGPSTIFEEGHYNLAGKLSLTANYKYFSTIFQATISSNERSQCGFFNDEDCKYSSSQGNLEREYLSIFSFLPGIIVYFDDWFFSFNSGLGYAKKRKREIKNQPLQYEYGISFVSVIQSTFKLNNFMGIGIDFDLNANKINTYFSCIFAFKFGFF